MGKLRNVGIAEQRVYADPKNPASSDYDVALPITVPDAVIDPATGKKLSETISEQAAAISTAKSESDAAIKAHNSNPAAHGSIIGNISQLEGEVARLEGEFAEIKLRVDTNITANAFSVTFKTLSGVSVTGVYNATRGTVDF